MESSFSALLPGEPSGLRELRAALTAWLERCSVATVTREATVLATHEAAAAIGNRQRPVRVSAALTAHALTVEVHAAGRAHAPSDYADGPIEPYQLIDALVDQVQLCSDSSGTTARLVQRLEAF